MKPLNVLLKRVCRRLSIQRFIRLNLVYVSFALIAALVWTFLTRFFPSLGNPSRACLALLGLGLVVGTIQSLLRRPTLLQSAMEADYRAGLHERLTSSLQLAEVHGPMADAVHQDAQERLEAVTLRKHFPYILPRETRPLAVLSVVFVLAYLFFPEVDLFHYRERQAEAKVLQEAALVNATRLRSTAVPLQKPEMLKDADLAAVAQEIERLSEKLENQEITEKQTLARMENLIESVEKHREEMKQQQQRIPQLKGDTPELGVASQLAQAIQKGDMSKAAEKARELQQKLKEGGMTPAELEKVAKDLENLAKMLGGDETELGKSLSEQLDKAKQSILDKDPDALNKALENMSLSMEDMASLMEQMAQLDMASAELAKAKQSMLGPSKFCRMCGKDLKPCKCKGGKCKGCGPGYQCSGVCGGCAGMFAGKGSGNGLGMGGPGRGRGNRTGELPDVNANYKPTMLTGDVTKGKVLASILQKGKPDENAEAVLSPISGSFVEVKQEAEQALNKEEIPAGAKELVRQYFGSIEPEKQE